MAIGSATAVSSSAFYLFALFVFYLFSFQNYLFTFYSLLVNECRHALRVQYVLRHILELLGRYGIYPLV